MQNILFLAHRVPFPPNRGDKIRAHHLLRKLAGLGRVHVGCFAETDEDRSGALELGAVADSFTIVDRTKPLALAGAQAIASGKPVSLTAFHSAKLAQWVRKTISDKAIDTIVVFSGQMGQYVPDDFTGRVVIDLCDVDSAKFGNYADAGDRVWLNRREARLLAAEEERLTRRADATLLITKQEADLLRSRLSSLAHTNIQVMGNGIDAEFFDPSSIAAEPGIAARPGPHFVFTGQMDYRPNEQAAVWVAKTVLPLIRETLASAEFHVVGRNPTAALLEFDRKNGVTVWGEVPDVRPYIAAADCVLAPLMIARGVQNKVLEAMAMRRPVVLTAEAATGIAAQDGQHWHIAPSVAEEFAAAAVEMASDCGAQIAMGLAAREFVIEHHAWAAMLEPLDRLIRSGGAEVRNAA
ncbi:TIGR03087 family PEP-CTERM/XrtA system glycosyltransferase [Erythrobacter sp. MTPC3]|uniref:TIGR03087 family PEP-CTERM/XrtA system glycosyltransferase n=1 Tax=Erythrobacter sp. MTPC3 TaxID=3056564 RepID=UPI0036F248EB